MRTKRVEVSKQRLMDKVEGYHCLRDFNWQKRRKSFWVWGDSNWSWSYFWWSRTLSKRRRTKEAGSSKKSRTASWRKKAGTGSGEKEIDAVDKFNYLKNQLYGNASEVISGLELTKNNYYVAIDLLKERYGKK